jgi:uncharacterized protein
MTATQTTPAHFGYTPSSSASLRPVAPSERIAGLDLLRGWAMFGVLWSNLNDWYDTANEVTRLDRVLGFAQNWLLESRFYELLVVLFGIGFAIQLTRARTRGVDLRNLYLRRSAALLGIGLIHALLIWHGDILISYALASFALLLFRDASPRQQLVWAVVLICAGSYIGNHIRFALGLIYPIPEQWWGGSAVTYATGTLAEIQRQRFRDVWHWWGFFGLNSYLRLVGTFVLGAWAYRSGLAERVITNRRTTLRFLAVCIAVMLVGYSVQIYHWDVKIWPQLSGPRGSLLQWRAWNPRNIVFAPFYQTALAGGLAYASLLLLAFQTQLGKRLLTPLAATGRMGLTTYLTQSLVCTTLFYSYGLGWFGKVGYTGMFEITVVLFAIQMVISPWWLKRFQFGPVEWLWRTITYGRAPAMRVAG